MTGPHPERTGADRAAVRVVVVDDHELVRRGLSDLIDDEPGLTVCGESGTAQGALALVQTQEPDVVIVDLTLGAESGLDLVTALATAHPRMRILVLSAHDELLFAERALKAGAHGYITKAQPSRELLLALRRVAGGQSYVSESVSERLVNAFAGRARNDGSPIDQLTDRERHVLRLVGQGLETRQIAQQLSVSPKTVESHYAHIKEKLGLTTGRELIRVAVSWTESTLT